MSAGHSGAGTPEGGDDPFGYLYRQEGGDPRGAPQAPPQPGYQQVRPVGERAYGGQAGGGYGPPPASGGHPPQQAAPPPPGYGAPQSPYQQSPYQAPQQPPAQPNAYYAAPETQPGAGLPPGKGGPGVGGFDEEPPRRNNGLLIGAIAVVASVVIGVGAAILFSDDGDGGAQAKDDASTAQPDDGSGDGGEGSDKEPEEPEETEPEFAFPEPVFTELGLANGAFYRNDGAVAGARSDDGSYIDGLDNPLSTVTWTFDFEGPEGAYRLYIGYSVPKGNQEMSFAVGGEPRDDKINFKDYAKNDDWSKNWVSTWKGVYLTPGENSVHLGCVSGDTCKVIVDKLELVPDEDAARPKWAGG